jgi:type II secretory pathway component GspD/PulD (secretin)/tetratricopeptide (TPR) repeat protein
MARTGCALLLAGSLGLFWTPTSLSGQGAAPAVPDEVKKDAEAGKAAPATDAKAATAVDLDKLAESVRQNAPDPAATAKQTDAPPAAATGADPALKSQAETDVKAQLATDQGAPGAAPEGAAAIPATPLVEPEAPELSAVEKVRRTELELMADELAVQAMKLWRLNDYKLAADKYLEAKARLNKISLSQPRIAKKKENIDASLHNLYSDWAASLIREAQQLVSVAKVEAAIEKCNQAGTYDPSRRELMDERIRKYRDLKKQLELKEMTKPELIDNEKEQRDFDTKVALEQGKVFLKNRRYADARDKFEKVLLTDPYEVSAIRYLRQINEELDQVGVEKYHQVVSERIAEVRWRWSEPVNPVMSDAGPDARSQVVRKGDGESGIRAKMKNIKVTHIEYDDMPVREVIADLKQKSMELDTEDGTGVNIILQTASQLPEIDLGPASRTQGGGAGGGAGGAGGGLGGFDAGFGGGGAAAGMGMGGGGAMGAGMGAGGAMGPGMGAGGAMGPGMGAGMGAMGPGMGGPLGTGTGGMEQFDGFGEAAAPGAAAAPTAATSIGDRPITMTLDNVPLGDVIDYICKLAGLKNKVEEFSVILVDQSVPFENLETRFYNVAAGVFDAKRTRKKADKLDFGSSESGGGSDDDDDSSGSDDDDDSSGSDDDDDSSGTGGQSGQDRYMINVDEFFANMGISFPQGARMTYFQRQGKLIVHNTPENHRRIQTILAEINDTPKLVTIEAKFVEVQQTNFDALGFDWSMNAGGVSYNPGTGNGDHFLSSDVTGSNTGLGQGSAELGVAKGASVTNGLRYANEFFSDFAGTDELFSTYMILGNYGFKTVVHALEQQANGDVLSSPKVTTLSGTTAILRMVTERYFPESWTEPEVTAGSLNTGASYKPSIPTFGEARDIGVILEVLPTVASDNYSIDLELKPQVIDFIGYDDAFNYDMVINGQTITAKASMPILSSRTVETKVIVWDGETVVLGGMIQERVQKYEDKVPLIGDIPVLGRLFRSSGEKSAKVNLLVFVTARLVDPSGRPLRPNEVRGMHDFGR